MDRDPGGERVLVTGAAGFLGTALCRALVDRGAEVHAVSRRAEPGARGGVVWWRRDLTDQAASKALLTELRPTVVFHLAGLAAGARRLDLVAPTLAANLVTTVHLLGAAVEAGCGRIVLAGSLEEPDAAEPAAVPSSPYAASKWAASAYGRMFHALFDAPVVIARIFMAYGPGPQDERKLLPYVVRALLRGEAPRLTAGDRLVDWVYVDDVAEGLVRLGWAGGIDGETIDLGTGEPVTIRRFVERLAELAGSPARPQFGALPDRPLEQVRAAAADRTLARIGWRATTPLDEGLRRTLDWYAHREMEAAR
jgi:nucleoside-diphosphate-sugar epimerase